jgi:hypothetical protein
MNRMNRMNRMFFNIPRRSTDFWNGLSGLVIFPKFFFPKVVILVVWIINKGFCATTDSDWFSTIGAPIGIGIVK